MGSSAIITIEVSAVDIAIEGGIVKYLSLPLFQSYITIFAPCFIYGTPPCVKFIKYLPEFSIGPTDLSQKVSSWVEWLDSILLDNIGHFNSLQNCSHNLLKILVTFESVLKNELILGQLPLKDDSRTIHQFNFFV